jgi:hypothetical protein
MHRFIIAAMCLLLLPGLAFAQAEKYITQEDPELQSMLEQMIGNTFLTLADNCTVPPLQPEVTVLKRSYKPDKSRLIKLFLGDEKHVTKQEQVTSPLWGRGTRMKSGMVLNLVDLTEAQQYGLDNVIEEHEMVPVFLDVYSTGFVYANNIPHLPVFLIEKEDLQDFDQQVTRKLRYTQDEGQEDIESMISDMFGKLKVPAGFQSSVSTHIQDVGENLFVYRVHLEYITESNIYETQIAPGDGEGQPQVSSVITAVQPMGIPVFDVYIHALLDGDKMLAGMEYFWDDTITPVGEPREAIHASKALMIAKDKLFAYFEEKWNGPPLLTVTNIQLGFIQNRRDRSELVPVWLFSSYYTEMVDQDEEALTQPNPLTDQYVQDVVTIAFPFAINALTEDLYVLFDE